jgi:hypothetical protein
VLTAVKNAEADLKNAGGVLAFQMSEATELSIGVTLHQALD